MPCLAARELPTIKRKLNAVLTSPTFESNHQFISHLGDTAFWRPYVSEILSRHGLADAGGQLSAGFNATHPTFICGNVVVKLFGHSKAWRRAHSAERAAQVLIATDPEISAPRLLGEGRLFDDDSDGDAPWPYLITNRMNGVSWHCADLSGEQKRSIAAELRQQVKRLHALRPSGVATHEDWQSLNVTAANAQSSLPPHLVAQIDEFLTRLEPFDRVFAHGDVVANHVFIENGHLAGIIDWGDALVTDRHYELIQPHRDMFDCDKALLRAFLDASDWPVGKNFHRQALGMALHRQAIGLAQHRSMDVFEPVAALFPLQDIATLDELASEMFAV